MSNRAKRLRGATEELAGAVKEAIGDRIGNEQMQAEGHVQKVKGRARQSVAKAEERATGVGEELAGKTQGAVGRLIGNEQLRVEGKIKELKGKARRSANR